MDEGVTGLITDEGDTGLLLEEMGLCRVLGDTGLAPADEPEVERFTDGRIVGLKPTGGAETAGVVLGATGVVPTPESRLPLRGASGGGRTADLD